MNSTKGMVRAFAGTKFARQIASANSKVLQPKYETNSEIAAWNHRTDVEKQAKEQAKKKVKERNHGTQSSRT